MSDKDIYNSARSPIKTEEKDETPLINKEEEFEWGKHPNSLKAIKKHQWKPNQSGNPLGRKPSFDALAKQLKKMGEEEVLDWRGQEVQGTKKQLVLERIWKDAMSGNYKMIKLLCWLGCLD